MVKRRSPSRNKKRGGSLVSDNVNALVWPRKFGGGPACCGNAYVGQSLISLGQNLSAALPTFAPSCSSASSSLLPANYAGSIPGPIPPYNGIGGVLATQGGKSKKSHKKSPPKRRSPSPKRSKAPPAAKKRLRRSSPKKK